MPEVLFCCVSKVVLHTLCIPPALTLPPLQYMCTFSLGVFTELKFIYGLCAEENHCESIA